MLEENAKIQALLGDNPDTEVAILALMLWSDSTHLTSFGMASLWPIYLFFGNILKYTWGKPTVHQAHHLAYVPSVNSNPDAIFRAYSYVPIAPQYHTRCISQSLRHCGKCRGSMVSQGGFNATSLALVAR